jgi:hypothetical protein
LAAGVDAAAKLLQGGSGDILIMTDGQVLGTEKILESARAAGVRLHCLGIGSASQDRFLTLLARETGGVSRFVTPRERVDLSTVDLFASIGRPVATGLKAGANIQPEPASMVFGSTPVLLFGEGEANVDVTWNGGQLILPVSCCDDTLGETLWLLQGSRLITDWESRYPSIEALAPLEKRKQSRVAMRLQQLSETYGLASREASLVAVVKRAGDRPGELPETHVVAVGMPQDTAFASYFQSRPRIMASALGFTGMRQFLASAPQNIRHVGEVSTPMQKATFLQRMAAGDVGAPDLVRNFEPEGQGGTPGGPIEALVELASRMDSDGGMPGRDVESRAAGTAVALLAFVSHGHTPSSGAFRSHVTRLVSFLKKITGVSKAHEQLIAGLIRRAEKGEAPAGDWIGAARGPGDHWDQLAKAL